MVEGELQPLGLAGKETEHDHYAPKQGVNLAEVDLVPLVEIDDDWIDRTQCEGPYNDETAPHAIPKTFKMPPYLKIYDGTTDPEDHVTHYVTAVNGNDTAKEQMTDKSVTALVGAKKTEARVNDIFAIKQSPGEGLRDGCIAFQNELNRNSSRATRKLLSRLMKYLPTTWDKIHNAYYAEVCADEDDLNRPTHRLTSVQAESRKDQRNYARKDLAAPRPFRERHQSYIRSAIMPPSCYEEGPSRPRTRTHRNERGMPPLLSTHNFSVSPSEIVYILEKLGPKAKWPQKMRSDPSTKKSNVLCEFHQERGHKTEDCIVLSQEVVNMLHQGHLKEFLSD
ncbi:PREDICTED: uncharacterized protein LOC109238855 [Nicotiana attenuata]|uniref:uncharacterized protein LOC109238855 n=1 Tax=Nicotiana attenuata TaxID=49451 RepID=UPI000904DE81|nr:PREDICTED: uncharacterized protein LOC109238855 [Nicotiana attenuata]